MVALLSIPPSLNGYVPLTCSNDIDTTGVRLRVCVCVCVCVCACVCACACACACACLLNYMQLRGEYTSLSKHGS